MCVPLCTPNRSSKPVPEVTNSTEYVDKRGFGSVPHGPKPAVPVSPASLGSPDRHGCILQLLASFPWELQGWDGPEPIRRTQATAPDMRAGTAPPFPLRPTQRTSCSLRLGCHLSRAGHTCPQREETQQNKHPGPAPTPASNPCSSLLTCSPPSAGNPR